MVGGRCWIPGSIFDGGMAGVPDSDGFSGVIPGLASDPFSGSGAGGTTSAPGTSGGTSSASPTVTIRPTISGMLLFHCETTMRFNRKMPYVGSITIAAPIMALEWARNEGDANAGNSCLASMLRGA
jgi:hypothetical protein